MTFRIAECELRIVDPQSLGNRNPQSVQSTINPQSAIRNPQ